MVHDHATTMGQKHAPRARTLVVATAELLSVHEIRKRMKQDPRVLLSTLPWGSYSATPKQSPASLSTRVCAEAPLRTASLQNQPTPSPEHRRVQEGKGEASRFGHRRVTNKNREPSISNRPSWKTNEKQEASTVHTICTHPSIISCWLSPPARENVSSDTKSVSTDFF